MQLKPTKQTDAPDYPTSKTFGLERRAFLRLLSGVALGVTAGQLLAADEKKVAEGKTLSDQVKNLAAKLGNEDFRVRRKATAALIAIGKGDGKSKTADAKAKALVLATLEPLKKAKDPEVAQRAKTIITSLTPKPKVKPRPRMPLKGDVAVLGGMG